MNLPGDRIGACLGKAALKRAHSRRFAIARRLRSARSDLSAFDLSALSIRHGEALCNGTIQNSQFSILNTSHEPESSPPMGDKCLTLADAVAAAIVFV